MRSSELSRRALLASSAIGVAGLAGCVSHFEEAIYLGGVRVENRTESERSFDVRITKEDVVVHESTQVDVPGDPDGEAGIFVDCDWPNQERGEFEIAIREADANDWAATVSTEAERDEYCQLSRVEYPEDEFRFFWEDCSEWRFGDGDDPLCTYGF